MPNRVRFVIAETETQLASRLPTVARIVPTSSLLCVVVAE